MKTYSLAFVQCVHCNTTWTFSDPRREDSNVETADCTNALLALGWNTNPHGHRECPECVMRRKVEEVL